MGIQGRASLLLLEKNHADPDREHLQGIMDYIKNAASLTKQLLGFAMGGKYEVKPTNINRLIQAGVNLFGRTKKEIRFQTRYSEDIWNVEVDRGQIDQVLMNLFINAWQAMPGGGDIYIETQNAYIDEIVAKPFEVAPGKYVKVAITDTGVGMDAATKEKIFEPFFTTRTMGRGTGLGMASV